MGIRLEPSELLPGEARVYSHKKLYTHYGETLSEYEASHDTNFTKDNYEEILLLSQGDTPGGGIMQRINLLHSDEQATPQL